MFLAKIKDSFMFGGNPNKSHWYLVYTRNNKVLYLKQTTHLYKPDIKRMEQVKYGVLRKAKLTSFDVPSGIYKKKIYKSFLNKKISKNDILNNSYDLRFNTKCKYLK